MDSYLILAAICLLPLLILAVLIKLLKFRFFRYAFLIFIVFCAYFFFTQKSSEDKFRENETEIYAFKEFYSSILPKDHLIDIEFDENYERANRLVVIKGDKFLGYWDDEVSGELLNSYFSGSNLEQIRTKLKEFGFLSVGRYEKYSEMIMKRSGFVAVILRIYDKPFNDEELDKIARQSSCHLIKDNVLIASDAGATGGGCYF